MRMIKIEGLLLQSPSKKINYDFAQEQNMLIFEGSILLRLVRH